MFFSTISAKLIFDNILFELYTYMVYSLYVAIPDALADNYSSCNFTFGFFDGFENQELSYIRSFEDDPISLCLYQYDVKLK